MHIEQVNDIKAITQMKNIDEVKEKYITTCDEAWNLSCLDIEFSIKAIEAKHDRKIEEAKEFEAKSKNCNKKQLKKMYYAIALGWTLNINEEDTMYRCDTQFN